MKPQNAERRQTSENQNEEESNSQANRRDRTSREDSTRMDNELRIMRKEMDKDKGRENLDGMIQRTDSPFTTEALNRPLPQKFRLPQLESNDSSRDPLDHIELFKSLMLLEMTSDEVMCWAFPTTLKRATRVWFSKISPRIIADFEQLSKGFVRHFIGGQRHKKQTGHLLNIQQAEGESQRQYIT